MSSLRDFLVRLDAAGELHRVRCEVSPVLEIAEIADRQSKLPCPRPSAYAGSFDPGHARLGGKALLFQRVAGCDFPVAINVFGSYRRMEMALGCEQAGGFDAIARRIAELTRPEPPRSLGDLIAKGRRFLPLLRTPPRRRRRAARCQQVVRLASRGEVDLRRLGLIQCWPLDGDLSAVGWNVPLPETGRDVPGADPADYGRYVTFAGMHTISAGDADAARPSSHNIGMYRAQLLGPTHLAMHWHVHHDGAAHWRSWKRAGKPMPIAICFGGEPVLPYAATAPLPPGISELLMAGYLAGRGIELAPARTVPLWVPASSEIVIEGWVRTDAGPIDWTPAEPVGPGAAVEGPFGDHTGYYSLPDRYPIVEVSAVTHCRDAVFSATIVGPPPQEDYYMGKATERIFLPLLKVLVPDIDDYHLPMFGCFHNCAFVRIRKAYPLQARRVMHAIWGAGQMAWTKLIVVVDHDVDVHDEPAALAAVFASCDFGRDLERVRGPLDILDHAAARLGAGGKLGIDATRKVPGEEAGGSTAEPPFVPESIDGAVGLGASLAGRHGVIAAAAPAFGRGRLLVLVLEPGADVEAAARSAWSAAPRGVADLIVAVTAGIDANDRERVLFVLCANTDPARDLIRDGCRVAVDATTKAPGHGRHGEPVRAFPPYIEMSREMREHVAERWGEYGLEREARRHEGT